MSFIRAPFVKKEWYILSIGNYVTKTIYLSDNDDDAIFIPSPLICSTMQPAASKPSMIESGTFEGPPITVTFFAWEASTGENPIVGLYFFMNG